MASVSAPVFERFLVGQYLFWLGEPKKPSLPTLSIFTAPAGLCLAGYISVFARYNNLMLGWLILLTASCFNNRRGNLFTSDAGG